MLTQIDRQLVKIRDLYAYSRICPMQENGK